MKCIRTRDGIGSRSINTGILVGFFNLEVVVQIISIFNVSSVACDLLYDLGVVIAVMIPFSQPTALVALNVARGVVFVKFSFVIIKIS